MRKLFTLLFLATISFGLNAQEVVINGDFSDNDASGTLDGLAHWYMDIDKTPGSGVGGDAANYNVYLTGDDTASIYQVVDVIGTDSVIYELTFWANSTWQAEKVAIIASTSDADTSMRTIYQTDSLTLTGDSKQFTYSFAFAPNSPLAGKNLILEFACYASVADSWMNIDAISLVKKSPGTNSKPLASAGSAQKVTGGDVVTLDGSGSNDTDGDDLTYNWISQFPGITFSDASAVNPTFTAPEVTEITVYNFALFVNDGTINSDTVNVSVTVLPAGELIRNGDFKTRGANWETNNSLKEIKSWNMDADTADISAGIWDLEMIHLTTADPSLYQIVDKIDTDTTIYTLTFSAKQSWYCEFMNSIFSVGAADSTIRIEIDKQQNALDVDPVSGAGDDFVIYKHVLAINAGSPHVNKNLIVEFQPTLLTNAAGETNGWSQLEYVSLVKKVINPGGSGVDIEEVLTGNNSFVYPNPSKETINLDLSGFANNITVQVFDITGKQRLNINNSNESLNNINTNLENGVYFIRVSDGKLQMNQKFIIAK